MGRLQIEDELEPGRQLDRQIAGILTVEYAAGIDAEQAIAFVDVRSIAYEPTRHDELAQVGTLGARNNSGISTAETALFVPADVIDRIRG